jgi:flavin reductase (DIM6/NTAB) family NADH-FMN oxidoreductase RutF
LFLHWRQIVIGRVVGIHIDESVITDGQIDIKTEPVARCGGPNVSRLSDRDFRVS